MQARLAAASDVLLDLYEAVLALPNFYIERGPRLDWGRSLLRAREC
ncbi:hypothetical protein ACLBXB_26150 [Methylobacterium mesophilicum]